MPALNERHEELVNTLEAVTDLNITEVEEIVIGEEEAFLTEIEREAIFPIGAYTDAATEGLDDVYSIRYETGTGIARHLAQEGDDIVFLGADKDYITVEPLRPAGAVKFDADFRYGKNKAANAVRKLSRANAKSWIQNQLNNFDEYPTQRATVDATTDDGKVLFAEIKDGLDAFLGQADKTPDQVLIGRDIINRLTSVYYSAEADKTVWDKLQEVYGSLEWVERRGLNGKGFFIVHDTMSGNTSSLERPFATKAINVSNGIAEGIAGRHAAIGVIIPNPQDVLVVEVTV